MNASHRLAGAVCASALFLCGCGEVPLSTRIDNITNSLTKPADTPEAKPVRPSATATTGVAGNAGSTGASSGATVAQGGSMDSARSSTGKTVALATFEGDMACTRLVSPFDISDNLVDLLKVGQAGTVEAVGDWFEQVKRGSAGKAAAKKSVATSKHNIAYDARVTAMRMNWLPMEAEVWYGKRLLSQMADNIEDKDSEQGAKLYPKADKLLKEVLDSVGEPHDYKFEVHVTSASSENAMALPGGFILIDPALLRGSQELNDKAYFAVAHEVAHVLQRHETRAAQARIIDMVSLNSGVVDLVKTMKLSKTDPKVVIDTVLAGKLQFERHFASQELHADGCGVRLLSKTLRNDTRLISVLNAFIKRLPRPTPDKRDDPFAELAPGLVSNAAPTPTPASTRKATANVQKTASAAGDLADLVTRPIDRHPNTKQRVDNLNRTLADVRKHRDAAEGIATTREKVTAPKPEPPAKTSKTAAPAM